MVKSRKSDGITEISVDGEMNIFQAADLKARLLAAMEGATSISLDLSEVEEMDTSGFQLLLLMKAEAARRGMGFSLSAVSPPVTHVIETYHMAAYFGEESS